MQQSHMLWCIQPPVPFAFQLLLTVLLCVSACVCSPGVLWSDGRAVLCSLCGDNIRSEPRDLDENPKVANGSLIRATSTSCCKWQHHALVYIYQAVTGCAEASCHRH